MGFPSLKRKQVIEISKGLRARGEKLPKRGWCKRIRPEDAGGDRYVREVCHDANGYYLVRSTTMAGYRKR